MAQRLRRVALLDQSFEARAVQVGRQRVYRRGLDLRQSFERRRISFER
jgi:hypothetical protein